jgi:hypothetical protein
LYFIITLFLRHNNRAQNIAWVGAAVIKAKGMKAG